GARGAFRRGVRGADPRSPKLVGSSPDEPGVALALAVAGNYAYVGSKRAVLHILDVSYPHAPAWVGSYQTPGRANGVTVSGAHVYVNHGDGGLLILRPTVI